MKSASIFSARSAGLRDELTPDEFISFKFFLIIFFPLVGGMLRAMELLDVSMWTLIGSGAAGWFYPNFWASGRVGRRQKDILKAMPFSRSFWRSRPKRGWTLWELSARFAKNPRLVL